MIPDEKMREIALGIARRLLCDEIASALSAARREGIEEAAKVADEHVEQYTALIPADQIEHADLATAYGHMMQGARGVATSLRALKEKP